MKRLFKTKEKGDESCGKNKASDSDFGGWGEYFHAKQRKLDKQFEEEKDLGSLEDRDKRKIFENVVIHVNGYTIPSSDELRRLIGLHGGRYQQYYSKSTVTHIIATNLPNSKIKELRSEKVVRPEWITDSIKMGKLCPITPYLLYSTRTVTQPALGVSRTISNSISSVTSTTTGTSNIGSTSSTTLLLENKHKTRNENICESFYSESEKDTLCTGAASERCDSTCHPGKVANVSDNSECTSLNEGVVHLVTTQPSSETSEIDSRNSAEHSSVTPLQLANTRTQIKIPSPKTCDPYDQSRNDLTTATTELVSPTSVQEPSTMCGTDEPSTSADVTLAGNQPRENTPLHGHPKAGDPNFVSTFYSNSRLHYLSTWSAELKQFVNKLVSEKQASGPEQGNVNKNRGRKPQEKIIMHIDMDCFFVSVTLCERPELRGKPIAVCHAGKTSGASKAVEGDMPLSETSLNSMSEIASCSYEARACGVRNGRFLGEARKLCPNIVCVPYEFDKYRKVSQQLYEILVSYSHDIEAVSCDEAYVDVTHTLRENQTPMELAMEIRQKIKETTGCPASVGISYNVLLARMCTREAKPNGQFYLPSSPHEAVQQFIGRQKVKDLPGVGWALGDKLHSLNVHSCAELQQLSLQTLQQQLGNKTGQNLYSVCRGEDDRPLKTEHARKSVSAEINYGIRFTQSIQADKFIEELAEEVHKRLQNVGLMGKHITLKLKVRKKGAPMPAKFMGHGICDNIARSCTLPKATDDTGVISNQCIGLFHQLKVAVPDIRGMGVQVSKLTNEENGMESRKLATGSLLQFVKPVHLDIEKGAGTSEAGCEVASTSGHTTKVCDTFTCAEQSGKKSAIRTSEGVSRNLHSPETGDISLPPLPRFSPTFTPPGAGRDTHTRNQDTHQVDDACLPSPSQVDPAVFAALPEDIRLDLEREYAARNQQLQLKKKLRQELADERTLDKQPVFSNIGNTVAAQVQIDNIQENNELSSPTEIDASFLEALPENLRLEVEQDFKNKQNKKLLADKQAKAVSPLKYKHSVKGKSPSRNRSPSKRKSPAKGKSPVKSGLSPKVMSPVRTGKKCDLVILEGKSSDKSESAEASAKTQVSLAGAVKLPDVKQMLRDWVVSCDESGPCADDVEVVVRYLSELIRTYNLELMWTILKFMRRLLTCYPSWERAFNGILEHVQGVVHGMYGSRLPRLPSLLTT